MHQVTKAVCLRPDSACGPAGGSSQHSARPQLDWGLAPRYGVGRGAWKVSGDGRAEKEEEMWRERQGREKERGDGHAGDGAKNETAVYVPLIWNPGSVPAYRRCAKARSCAHFWFS